MSITRLGWEQAIRNSFDEPSNSLRTTMQNLEIAVELSADDGDSVISRPQTVNAYNSVNGPQAAQAIIIPATNVSFCKEVSIMVNNADGATQVSIEVSPSDTLDIWHQISTHNAPNGTSHHEPTFFPCRRLRVRFVNTYTNPAAFQVWLNGRA
jgi:hypothetical protein